MTARDRTPTPPSAPIDTRDDAVPGAPRDGRAARWAHRRPELLAAATEYVLDNGVSQLTLRPLAAAIGVTISTLIRQFGSKADLIEEITRNINLELLEDLRTDPELTGVAPAQTLRVLWRRWLDPVSSRHFRLMFELYTLALQDPEAFAWFTDSVVADWLAPITDLLVDDGADRDHARVVATVVLATLRGLHLDYIVTRDADRIDAAFELVFVSIDPGSSDQGAGVTAGGNGR